MSEPGQIRINELARELEIKAKVLIEYLPEIGVTEKKTHSSSLDHDQAEKVRRHFRAQEDAEAAAAEEKQKAAAAKPKPVLRPGAEPASSAAARPAQTPGVHAPPLVAQPAKPPIAAKPAAPAAVPGVKPPVPPRTVPTTAAPTQAAGSPASAAPAQHTVPAARTAQPSHGAPVAPVQRTGTIPPQKSPIVNRPAAASRPAAAPGTQRIGGTRPGTPGSGQPLRPGAGQGMRAGAPAGRPGSAPMRTTQRPGGRAPGAGQHPVTPLPKPEPGKPLYVRKPSPTRAKPTIEKRFAEGERKLHPVRSRIGAAGGRGAAHAEPVAPVVREPRDVTITEGITVRELAEKLDLRAKELLKTLLDRGIFASINQALDVQTASSLAESFNGIVHVVSFEEQMAQEDLGATETKTEQAASRAPVVTVMGHVDHGKTSLLDAIRSTEVAAGESGGITQHIGASQVHVDGRRIVFIDTPGHEAFTRMRARGAKVTDIVVLVVAANDGVMPQTEEAIDHARAAKVPIIVAINKIDLPDAQPERVKRQLADRGLMPEEWGGDTVMVEVSAKSKKNIERLLEMILLVGDLRELRASPATSASGTVLESRVDKGRGPVATVLVQNGTLNVGDVFICGAVYGKVRAMFDDKGQPVKSAGPSTPVEVLGLQGVPDAGDQFQVADEAKARHIVEYRQAKLREASLAKSATSRLTLDQLHEQLTAGEVKDLPILIKADVQGSVEVLSEMLPKLSNDQVKLKIIHASVGAISETDVLLASASNAVIIGFNVRPERKASDLAQQESVEIRLHTIIYEVVDEIKKAMQGLLAPVLKEQYLGRAEVRDTFRVKGVGMIAGSYIQDGMIKRDAEVRVLRDNVVIYTGRVSSLRRFKDDVSEVRTGFECGIGISNFGDVKIGDILECFTVEKIQPLRTDASDRLRMGDSAEAKIR